MTKKRWTAKILENSDGDHFLEFPDELMEQIGWQEGDEIGWHDNNDGSYTLTKKTKSETEWVLVNTISSYRMRYLVEVPVGKTDYALDTVTVENAKEFDQLWLGETITDHRVITEQEGLDLFRDSDDIFAQWNDDVIKKNHFTFWVEE